MNTLDWVIIGGGIHGVHIAVRLLDEAGVAPERLCIVDPGERLLARWRTCTQTTGMRHLRSPAVHNLDSSPWSLKEYASARKPSVSGLFARPYSRPQLELFNEHCDAVISAFNLHKLHVRSRAVGCSVGCDTVTVQLADGTEVTARNVVLAMGGGAHPERPSWAPDGDARVQHVFSSDFVGWPSTHEKLVVVGGGISAGQVALRLVKEGHKVHLVSRHALREHQFDSEPGWLGPKFMNGFRRETDVNKRRAMITAARYKGSVPRDVRRALRAKIAGGRLAWHQGQIDAFDGQAEEIALRLSTGDTLSVNRVLLATGFRAHRPGGDLVDQLVESASLPCANCGYPIVDRSLRWHPRVYVSGPLAELELGPSSRNIAGARRAAERLVGVVRAEASVG